MTVCTTGLNVTSLQEGLSVFVGLSALAGPSYFGLAYLDGSGTAISQSVPLASCAKPLDSGRECMLVAACEVCLGPASPFRAAAADLEGGAVLAGGRVHRFPKSLPPAT